MNLCAFIDLKEMVMNTGFAHLQWQMVVMWVVVAVLLYLAIVRGFEPLLLVPISLGALISNLPVQEYILNAPVGSQPGGLFWYLKQGLDLGIYPPLIFMGVGAMIDFGPLIANPRTLLLGGAAQFGIFATFVCAPLLGFDMMESASIGIIGGADGPTSIFVTTKLAPHLLGPIAVAAYSYMALVPLIQPPIMKALTSQSERKIKMKTLRKVSQFEKVVFAAVVMVFCILVVPDATALIAMLFVGNLFRESKVTERLTKAASNEIINIVTIFLGLCVGLKMGGFHEVVVKGVAHREHHFLNPQTLGILLLGVIAFCVATASGVLMAKLMNLFSKNKINPLIGSAGVSAVPMAARVSHDVGMKSDPTNFLLMHAMGPNVAGVIGSALAAGYFLSLLN
ncbi:MAG: sodium ion-translocating decarboxylase subunit beta [Akkermansiaceae bacterium]|nr:sodium ion-translocating decarboxylase subunit beta [Akkermansiaceae bacterium]MCP5542569.1 sodium ion-translocating decarboxylase subunit beta [Akkermansiaceae bacterium]MCP5547891.1 sodium ion-translocating decarboxylase subunit beta [Akkermansiaceae bacterium]